MDLSAPLKIRKKKELRREAELKRRQETLRRRREQNERDRKRRLKWLIMLWASILESIPTLAFFGTYFAARAPVQPEPLPRNIKKYQNGKFDERCDLRTDYERLYISDCSPRFGEENQEVYDGVTWADIVAHNRVHKPWLFPKCEPIRGTPHRYSEEPLHIWTLLDHLKYDFLRKDAITALKLVVGPDAHPWIDACAATTHGWKQLCYCRARTPDATTAAFSRAATFWREEQRREFEEREREAKETPDSGQKLPGPR